MSTSSPGGLAREARRLRGSAIIAANLLGQRRIPFSPRPRIEARRDAAVRRIVRYAARTVPYYRDLFARERIDPREIRSAADLSRLPLIDRDLVRREPELFLSTSRRARDPLPFLTGGSTATPLAVLHDQQSVLANIAYGERERQSVIALCGGSFRPKEVYIGYETSNFKKVLRFYQDHARLPVQPRRITVPMAAPLDDIVAAIDEHRPDQLTAYGSFLDFLYRSVEARGIDMHRPKLIMYVGESLPRERRAWIEQTLGIHVLSRYCASEAFKIGYFCERATGFHLHEDLCHVRIVGRGGEDAPVGEPGEIVISNLVNHAMVLLNYPMGDIAAFAPETCPCGRTFRMITELYGRAEDVLPLPGGDILHPRLVWSVLKDDSDILQYQLVQHDLRDFELKLVTVDREHFPAAAEGARRRLAELLGHDARIETAYEPELGRLERETRGKFRAVLSHCRATAVRQATRDTGSEPA